MKRIGACLNPQLQTLSKRALQIDTINRQVLTYLPPELQAHCQAGSFSNGCLVLYTTDSVWATQLRYYIPELRDKLRRDAGLHQLGSIKISLAEPMAKRTAAKQKKSRISSRAQAAITESATHCSYEPLQEAMLKLAKQVC